MLVLAYLLIYGLPIMISLGLVLSALNGAKGFLKLSLAAVLSGLILGYLALDHSIYPLGDLGYGLVGQVWLPHLVLLVGALLAIIVKAGWRRTPR
jgi:hypothetical protein